MLRATANVTKKISRPCVLHLASGVPDLCCIINKHFVYKYIKYNEVIRRNKKLLKVTNYVILRDCVTKAIH